MSEAERLAKICHEQDKELKRLRRLLGTCRVACVDYTAEGNVLRILATCIGVDEYQFLDAVKPELVAIGNAILGRVGAMKMGDTDEAVDTITGEPLHGKLPEEPAAEPTSRAAQEQPK